MKIGLFTDPHYSDKIIPSANRYHSLSYDKIKASMELFKKENVELVICLGDLTDDCNNINDNPKALLDLSEMINSFGVKFYSLMGNHDCLSFTREEFNDFTNGAYPPFKYETEKSTLIFLDCNYEDSGNPYQVRNVDWTNTFLPDEQLEALCKTISDNTKEYYIFVHQNLDNEVDKYHIVHNSDKIRAILENHNVKMVIQGHYHLGHDTVINGIKYHTLSAMCEKEDDFCEILEIK